MKSTRHLRLLVGTVLPFSLLFAACSASDVAPQGDGDAGNPGGDGDMMGTGSTGGDGDVVGSGGLNGGGGTTGAGATPGDGDGDATGGGGGASAGRVPGTDDYNCEPPVGAVGALGLTQVGSGFTRPVLVTHAPGDARLFVVEQEGVIKINGGGTFLDIQSKAVGPIETDQEWDERGLLGLAFHPSYATNGLFYVFYSTLTSSVIAEYRVSADPNVADAGSERVLLTIPQTHENHKAGMLAFGADGLLYASVGDGGSTPGTLGGDPENNGQNPLTLKGTILRIDPAGAPYTARGNYPGGAPEVSDIGLRNPFRMNFDACNGDLYIGDVGQELVEEVNVKKAGVEHLNFGWNKMEGSTCFNAANKTSPLASCDQTGLTLPIAEYANGVNGASVIGGAVYRGSEIPALRGTYFYGDNLQGTVFSLVYNRDTGTATSPTNLTAQLPLTLLVSIQNGPGGELYFLSLMGTIHKLTAF